MIHKECMHGHVIDGGKDECSAGHISLFMGFKCPVGSCGFLSELRYSHVDIPLDKSYLEVSVHFKSKHGYELESNLQDLGQEEDDNAVKPPPKVKKNDSCIGNDKKHPRSY